MATLRCQLALVILLTVCTHTTLMCVFRVDISMTKKQSTLFSPPATTVGVNAAISVSRG